MKSSPLVIAALCGFVSASDALNIPPVTSLWLSPEQKASEERVQDYIQNIVDQINESAQQVERVVYDTEFGVNQADHAYQNKMMAHETNITQNLAPRIQQVAQGVINNITVSEQPNGHQKLELLNPDKNV